VLPLFNQLKSGCKFYSYPLVDTDMISRDTILSGKAKIVIAGGYDDFGEEGSFEFANMKATSNSVEEFAMGREPAEHSRPTSTQRLGFVEAQGAGIHVLMTAKTALEVLGHCLCSTLCNSS
jgi:3-oxoacyl-(acyl-carrier-protein) synthase